MHVALIIAFLAASATLAQEPTAGDRITLRAASPKSDDDWIISPPTQVLGQIQNFNQEELTIVATDGTVRKFDSRQIQEVKFEWQNKAVVDALKLFDERKYRESISALNEARKVDTPRWQQQFIIARIVQAAAAMGNTRTAGILFLDLAASQPPMLIYADMPLCWTVRDVEKPLMDSAKEWLASDVDEAKLLGASWQLFGPERELASQTLSKLQSSSNAAVAALAVAQAWRLVPPPETRDQYGSWLAFRDSLLLPLQLGPTEFLADRLQRVGEIDLAMEQWMRIATVHADRYDRTLTALKAAAGSLSRIGRAEDAKKIQIWIDEMEGT